MAILATVFGMLGRFAGRVLTTTLGWAGMLLFGRVRKDRQVVLAAITFGSVVWVALLLGVVLPDVGTILLGFVPVPDFIDPLWVRIAMLVAAIVLPLVVGAAILFLLDAADRPSGIDAIRLVLRGYPLTAALALTLVFLAVIGTVRKARVLLQRWSDAHIPTVILPGGYDRVVVDLEHALDDAGLAMTRRDAPKVLAVPGQVLARVAGEHFARLVPDRLQQLTGRGLEILVHQSDIAISGGRSEVARARAAIASRLTASEAMRTTSAEAQEIERQLTDLAKQPGAAQPKLEAIDRQLATLEIDADEWEVLYRIRLQVERDLLRGQRPGDSFTATGEPGSVAPGAEPLGTPPSSTSPVQFGIAALVGTLLAVDIVMTIRERLGGRA